MVKLSLAGFKDPVRRPRYIVWAFVGVLAMAAFVIVALGATSTKWFCAEVCHKVQDDTIRAYDASVHSEISCMACHEPVNASPVAFLAAKVKSGLEVIPTVANTFELPLNAGSHLALSGGYHMGSQQCTQCHSKNRVTTPADGIVMNHDKHAAAGVWCTTCHNRVAHNDTKAKPTLVDPSGKKNVAHADFMKMDYCFRCHDLKGKVKMTGEGAKAAPGSCTTCHTPGFELVPETHDVQGWAASGHGESAKHVEEEVKEAEVEAKVLEEEGIRSYLAKPVNACQTCHVEEEFCNKCHGLEMPHPKGFTTGHEAAAKKDAQVCVKCHTSERTGAIAATTQQQFCSDCHHKGSDPNKLWQKDHPRMVQAQGAQKCFSCHAPTACAKCHVRGRQ